MSIRLWSARNLVVWALLLGLASLGGSLDGREAPRRVIKGRIVSVGSEEPVAGAKVIIRGVGRATTNAAGRYKIRGRGDIAGLRQVVVRANGHVRRKTWLGVPDSAGQIRADWNVIPTNSREFDSMVFDQFTRPGAPSGVGTTRWEQVPVVRILTRQLECPGAPTDENCPEWIVLSEPLSSTFLGWFEIVIQDVPALMGGMVPMVEMVDLPAGSSIQTDSVLVPGAMTLVQVPTSNTSIVARTFPRVGHGEAIDGLVFLFTLGAFNGPTGLLRNVAYGVGYPASRTRAQHCLDLSKRGLRSIHCETHGLEHPSTFDVALGRALYTRSVGNQFPDIDPKPATGAQR